MPSLNTIRKTIEAMLENDLHNFENFNMKIQKILKELFQVRTAICIYYCYTNTL